MSDTFGHCKALYEAMLEGADESGVWTGALTSLVEELGIGQPLYTYITSLMVETGCIEQLRRGNSKKPSEWLVHSTIELDRGAVEEAAKRLRERRQKRPKSDLQQQINDLSKRVGTLEEIIT